MKGGFYKPKGRNTYRVWFSDKGHKFFINRYLDGSPLYHPAQAERVLEKIRSEVDQGVFDPASYGQDRPQIFQNAWRIYQNQHNAKQPRIDQRERIFKLYLFPYFQDKPLRDIEEHHLADWFSKLPERLTPSYRRLILAILKGFLSSFNVVRRKALRFPSVSVPRKVPVWLSRSEQDKIISCIADHHRPIFKFMQTYGCRSSEACNLKRTDIDLDKNIIVFRERKNEKENALPLFEEIKSLLLRPGRMSHWEYIFCTANGRKYRREILYHIWANACKKAGERVIPLKNATRHSLACQLLERGESSMTVSRILGNTPGVVERSYGTITVKRVEEVLKANLQK